MSEPTMEAMPSRPEPRVPRRRAPVACLGCRRRKVRCDVARHGSPCSNCRLDDEPCDVRSRRRHYVSPQQDSSKAPQNAASASPNSDDLEGNLDLDFEEAETSTTDHFPQNPEALEEVRTASEFSQASTRISSEPNSIATLAGALEPQTDSFNTQQTAEQPCPSKESREILYTYYSCLSQNNLSGLSSRDFRLLESQGCLHVPSPHVLDEFMQKYFLHVHPMLPMLDEADFWRDYRADHGTGGTVSLLLVQSMLFAACNCVSANAISSLGFSTARTARAELYRRAKLLYDMNAESSSQAVTQSALLLSLWTPPEAPNGKKLNTTWLVAAIHHARTEDAHLYQYWSDSRTDQKNRVAWKRIWWCCIIRDRFISLGLRRPPQITRDNFDFHASEPLCASDIYRDPELPSVYSAKARTLLGRMLSRLIDLCVILTDLQALLRYLEKPKQTSSEQWLSHLGEVRKIKSSLRNWYEETDSVFDASMRSESTASTFDTQRGALFVHLQMMYICYYSAATSLSHYEMLLVIMIIPEDTVYSVLRSSYTSRLFHELKDASGNFAQCLSALVKPGLIKFLPISVIAFLAMPLVHHILDLEFANVDQGSKASAKRERLNVLIEAMRIFRLNYDGVEWVSGILKRSLEQFDKLGRLEHESPDARQQIRGSPAAYLRIALTVDFSLNRSKYAQKSDIPECVESLFEDTASKVLAYSMNDCTEKSDNDIFARCDTLDEEWREFFELDSSTDMDFTPSSYMYNTCDLGGIFEDGLGPGTSHSMTLPPDAMFMEANTEKGASMADGLTAITA